jgi:hypothetical protein
MHGVELNMTMLLGRVLGAETACAQTDKYLTRAGNLEAPGAS